jgi:hypothetical protein
MDGLTEAVNPELIDNHKSRACAGKLDFLVNLGRKTPEKES